MGSHPSGLNTDDIYALMKVYQETGCNDAATKLLVIYEPIVEMGAKKVSRNRSGMYEDLFQVGRMSLLQLFEKFDPSLGTSFEAYAVKSIIGQMKNYLRDKSWYIQIPRRIKEKGLSVQQAINELMINLERSPRIDEIAEHMDLSLEETIEIISGIDHYHYLSLDAPASNNEQSPTIGDLIRHPNDDFANIEYRLDLEELLSQLKVGEREVIYLSFFKGFTQRDIAKRLGISQMSVSRIRKRAIDKLRSKLLG